MEEPRFTQVRVRRRRKSRPPSRARSLTPPPHPPTKPDRMPTASPEKASSSSSSSPPPREEKVKVLVRVRPLLEKERKAGCGVSVEVGASPGSLSLSGRDFTFDGVLGPGADQEDTYDATGRELVDSLFSGFNSTILAYGQTNSGKSYTMGTLPNSSGIIPRVVQELFAQMEAQTVDDGAQFLLRVSHVEIYAEGIRDLLDPDLMIAGGMNAKEAGGRRGRRGAREPVSFLERMRAKEAQKKPSLKVREDADGSVRIVGVNEVVVTTKEELFQTLARGARSRSTAKTAMNQASSRSHAIITLSLERHEFHSDSFTLAKLNLVDLAGSERLKRTNATGTRLKESKAINKGLLALGNVISTLAANATKPPSKADHVPYRSSKLTRVLQDSLGGSSRTIMVACISPADVNDAESLNTLKYASRARAITNRITRHAQVETAQAFALAAEVERLQMNLMKRAIVKDRHGNSVSVGQLLDTGLVQTIDDLVQDDFFRSQIAATTSSAIVSSSMALRASVTSLAAISTPNHNHNHSHNHNHPTSTVPHSSTTISPPSSSSSSSTTTTTTAHASDDHHHAILELQQRVEAADVEREHWLAFVAKLQERGMLDVELRRYLQEDVLTQLTPFSGPVRAPPLGTRPTTSAGRMTTAAWDTSHTEHSSGLMVTSSMWDVRPDTAPGRTQGEQPDVAHENQVLVARVQELERMLAEAQDDLERDEEIFAAKNAEIRQLHDLMLVLKSETESLQAQLGEQQEQQQEQTPEIRESTPDVERPSASQMVATLGVSPAVTDNGARVMKRDGTSLLSRMYAAQIEDANDFVVVGDNDDDDAANATNLTGLTDLTLMSDAHSEMGGDVSMLGADPGEVIHTLKARTVALTRKLKAKQAALAKEAKEHLQVVQRLESALAKEKSARAGLENKIETQAKMLRIKADQLVSAQKKGRSPTRPSTSHSPTRHADVSTVLLDRLEDELDELDVRLLGEGGTVFLEETLEALGELPNLEQAVSLLRTYFLKLVEVKEDVYNLSKIEIPNMEQELEKMSDEVAAAKDALADARQDSQTRMGDLEKDNYYYKTTNKDLKRKMKELVVAASQQQDEYGRLQAELESAHARLDQIRVASSTTTPLLPGLSVNLNKNAHGGGASLKSIPSLRPLSSSELEARANILSSSDIRQGQGQQQYEDDSLDKGGWADFAADDFGGSTFAASPSNSPGPRFDRSSLASSLFTDFDDGDVQIGSPPRMR